MSRSSEFDQENATDDATQVAADRAAFVSRLHAILRQWPSADRLARATGVSPSAFRKWLKGDAEPSRERLVALAEAASVSVGWLARGEGPEPRLQGIGRTTRARDTPPNADANLGPDFVLLPRRPDPAAADSGSQSPPPDAAFIALRHDWVRSVLGVEPEQLSVETALGESMQPGIRDGDLLFVDTSENRFRSFGIYVVEVAGERLVKRVQPKLDGSVTLISDNAAYETEHVPPAQAAEIRVIGRVMWTCGPLRGTRPPQA
jgi:phage repressor protein C with HTH and peptisase S24 domain